MAKDRVDARMARRIWKVPHDKAVMRRDGGLCFVCKEFYNRHRNPWEIHEILSASKWPVQELEECYSSKNMIAVCRRCHEEIQGQAEWHARLLQKLQEKYGYNYNVSKRYQRYLEMEIGEIQSE